MGIVILLLIVAIMLGVVCTKACIELTRFDDIDDIIERSNRDVDKGELDE